MEKPANLPSMPLPSSLIKVFFSSRLGIILSSLVFLKVLIAILFPVIGDEAYYFYWGRHFAGGYYDLSPMIGWWESAFSAISLQSWWLRIPNFLVMILVSFAMKEWLSSHSLESSSENKEVVTYRAKIVSLLYFFSPLPFLAVLISPDVPLVLFSFLSAFSFYHAMNTRSRGSQAVQFFIAGALWGAALLSKYFAFFLLPAFGLWFLFRKTENAFWKRPWWGLLVFALGGIPFLFQHLYWNATHCWANILFNFVTRQNVYDGPVSQTFGLYLVYLLLLATPVLIRDAFRKSTTSKSTHTNAKDDLSLFLFLSWSVPIFLFGVTALKSRGQGLHWYFSYVPFFFMWIGLKLNLSDLQKRFRSMLKITGVIAVIATVGLAMPDQTLSAYFKKHYTADYQFSFHPKNWMEQLTPHLDQAAAVLSDNYSMSSVLDHQLQKFYRETNASHRPLTNVWGDGSRFGRVYDWTIDWRSLEGKKIVIVTRGDMSTPRWKAYFSELKVFPVVVGDGELKSTVYISEGFGFKGNAFQRDVTDIAVGLYYPQAINERTPVLNWFPTKCSL